MLLIYSYVFGFIYDGDFGVVEEESKYEHAAAILIGITIFGYFSEILSLSPSLVRSNPNFVKKVVFPLEILSISLVAKTLFNLFIKFGFAAILIVFFCDGSVFDFLYLPIYIIPMVLLGIGISFLLSSVAMYIRDLSNLMGFINMALLFSSAVFYGEAMIPEEGWQILRFNPIIHLIEDTRHALLWQVGRDASYLLYVYVLSIAVFFLGVFTFNRLRPAFSDVL